MQSSDAINVHIEKWEQNKRLTYTLFHIHEAFEAEMKQSKPVIQKGQSHYLEVHRGTW